MKKLFLTMLFLCISLQYCFAISEETKVYCEKDKFGLMQGENKITEAKYSKLISLKEESYIFLLRNRFGIISKNGEILAEAKYTSAERYLGKFAKLGLNNKYVIYNEKGELILNDNYSYITLLYGGMFLVKKNYKYGITKFNGDILLEPIADDIYMPEATTLKILVNGQWYEITRKDRREFDIADELSKIELSSDGDFNIDKIMDNPVASAGYGVVSVSDYFIKMFSSISPAYEETIDELILSHGVDTANIIVKSGWLAKFPYTYMKNYINNLKTPNNGPLSDVKTNLKNKMN